MKVSEFCYEMHFHYCLPLQKISPIFPTRIEIIHGGQILYQVLTWLTLFSLHFIPSDKKFMKIMLPMLKLYTNSGFHELFLK
jgi:hypothetical protein